MNNVHGGNLGKKRPNFGPNHIKNIKQLKPGRLICFCQISDSIQDKTPSVYKVIEIIRLRIRDTLALVCEGPDGKKIERSLADLGVVPYGWGDLEGLYNQCNWIEKT